MPAFRVRALIWAASRVSMFSSPRGHIEKEAVPAAPERGDDPLLHAGAHHHLLDRIGQAQIRRDTHRLTAVAEEALGDSDHDQLWIYAQPIPFEPWSWLQNLHQAAQPRCPGKAGRLIQAEQRQALGVDVQCFRVHRWPPVLPQPS